MRVFDININTMDEDIIINDVGDSLNEAIPMESDLDNEESMADLPDSLIVTNLDELVYDNPEKKSNFEAMFKNYGEVSFQYFKSFRRARVKFESSQLAAAARIELHQAHFCERIINCYFAQPISPKDDTKDPFLQPPSPVKQFLISPPASPPVGWEPVGEAQPMLNYDLLAALSNLAPGESRELHPPSKSQPGIVVHPCEEQDGARQIKPVIQQTACPERRV